MVIHYLRRLRPGVGLLLALGAVTICAPLRAAELPSAEAQRPVVNKFQSAPAGLRERTFHLAVRAFQRAVANGQTAARMLTIIDYSLPSTERRLWVLDLARGKVLFKELVAHGKQTGENLAQAFSNQPGSYQSSLGAFLTGATYFGKHGLSLRLHGLEPGINDRAEERAIVMHAADYVSEDLARKQGRIGRSQGCPAVRPAVARKLIDTIRDGTLVFAYYPDAEYERASVFVAGR
jgi:hypothetical protein